MLRLTSFFIELSLQRHGKQRVDAITGNIQRVLNTERMSLRHDTMTGCMRRFMDKHLL